MCAARASTLAALAALATACTQTHGVALDVDVPGADMLGSLTVQVYRAGTCPSVIDVALDRDTTRARVYSETFRPGALASEVGRLDPGAYAFVAVARDRSCLPIGFGCVIADPSQVENVRIPVTPTTWDAAAASCPTSMICNTGLCEPGSVMCDPTSCSTPGGMMGRACCGSRCLDLSNDGSNCGVCGNACSPDQACVGGECTGTAECSATTTPCMRGTCCGSRCIDIDSDPSSCGACGHVCEEGLSCGAGICRVLDSSIRLTPDPSSTLMCGRLFAALIWIPVFATMPGLPPEVALFVPVGDAMTMREVVVRVSSASAPSDSVLCTSTDCGSPIALGHVVLVIDADADGMISPMELSGVGRLGIADVGVVWSELDVMRGARSLEQLQARTMLSFDEGLARGAAAYRRGMSADGTDTWVPLLPSAIHAVRMCEAMDCATPVDSSCRTMLPHPFGPIP